MVGMTELPAGWKWTTLDEVCEIILGQSPSSDTYNAERKGLPFYQGKAEFGDFYPTPVKWCTTPGKIAEAGDVLISVRAPVGPTNLCGEKSCIGRGLAALRVKDGMPNKYLLYYLRLIEREWDSKATGTTFKAITGSVLRQQEIPLPPLPEQERIVAKIEELFTQLDAGAAALRRVQAELKRYKASVLKAACEGRLAPQDELDQIAYEVLPGENDFKKLSNKKYVLPNGWIYTTIDLFLSATRTGLRTGPFGNLLKKHEHQETGIPVLGIENIGEMKFVHGSKIHITKEKANQLSGYDVLPGDVLISRSGTVGEVCVVPSGLGECRFSTNALRVVLNQEIILPDFFIMLFHGSPFILDQIAELCKGSTRIFLNQSILKAIIFTLPPINEQRRIISEVERRLSVIQEIEASVQAGLARAARLRQSILKRAFEGRLSGIVESTAASGQADAAFRQVELF